MMEKKDIIAFCKEHNINYVTDSTNADNEYTRNKIRNQVALALARSVSVCVIDAPLLIEAGLRDDCNFTLAVLADADIRIQRISRRDGIDHSLAQKRISSQKSDEFYIENTDMAIFNNGDDLSIELEIVKLLERLGVAHEKK